MNEFLPKKIYLNKNLRGHFFRAGVLIFIRRKLKMITKEEIKKKLKEDPNFTLEDDATDEDWDLYFEVKDEMGEEDLPDEEDSWEDDEQVI